MPWQLIYTSAPRGLLSGQSGFCTVARSADLREALVQRLEQISSYHYLRVAEAATANRNPAISAFRLLDLRGAKYYVLTRIQPCGLDFTARTNHLAHHLIFQPDELGRLPSPAAILRHWPGWMASWQGDPRVLEEVDTASFAAAAKNFLPARTWASLTGDGGRAAGLLESECVRGCYLLCPPGSEEQVLEMYCETLQLLNFNGQFPLRPWRHTFTAFLQAEDNPHDFQWRACQENTPACKQALTRSAPMMALRSVRVPANSLVKLAREEPKPPPPSSAANPKPPPSDPAPKSALLKTTPRGHISRSLSTPAPFAGQVKTKIPGREERTSLLHRTIVVNPATLTGLGIFVAVVVTLWVIKQHRTNPPEDLGTPARMPAPQHLVADAPERKEPAPLAMKTDAKPLENLMGDGMTYVLIVSNLAQFLLPIDTISPCQNLLHCYDRQDPGGLPGDILLEVNTDHWDFSLGSRMTVNKWQPGTRQFSASRGVSECVFDYSQWSVTRAFSIHFGFNSSSNGNPFRLLIVNEHNPPPPLPMDMHYVQKDRQNVQDSLEVSLRRCLSANFTLLAGRQWQLRPYLRSKSGPAQYLYQDWPANDTPVLGCELDFSHITQRLQAHREDYNKSLDRLRPGLSLPLGSCLELTNAHLQSFAAFSPGDLTRSRFLDYLTELKKTTPTNSWIRQWHEQFGNEQPGELAETFEKLYGLWCETRPQDRPMLSVTNAGGPTNYFYDAWELLKERQQVQEQLDHVQRRLMDLDHFAYIGLCIIDPTQPRTALEMIRFERL
jgi:hypothetical protein